KVASRKLVLSRWYSSFGNGLETFHRATHTGKKCQNDTYTFH
ncbi:MAG: hypothetical protein ACI9GC_001160, partial [Phycisphaerales bacterium]